MEMLVERLSEAMLPRVLHWRRKIEEEEDAAEKKAQEDMLAKQGPLELVIVSSTIISGAFPMVKALFGSNDTCTGMTNLTIASPKPDGCSKIKRSSTSDPKGSIVAILRAACATLW